MEELICFGDSSDFVPYVRVILEKGALQIHRHDGIGSGGWSSHGEDNPEKRSLIFLTAEAIYEGIINGGYKFTPRIEKFLKHCQALKVIDDDYRKSWDAMTRHCTMYDAYKSNEENCEKTL
jgi:hypothetical protein